jgi:hypothetical protein
MDHLSGYEAPRIETLGSIAELTEVFNKIGRSSDQFTPVTGGLVVGSLVQLR